MARSGKTVVQLDNSSGLAANLKIHFPKEKHARLPLEISDSANYQNNFILLSCMYIQFRIQKFSIPVFLLFLYSTWTLLLNKEKSNDIIK